MTPLRQQMIAALQLRGKGARTPQSSVRAVRLLAQFDAKSPDVISEPALQASCLHRKNVDGLAPASMRICSSGIRLVSQHVLKRAWHPLSLMRAHTAHRLPAVLHGQEVRRRLKAAPPRHTQVSCTTVYRLGLRRHEALSLQVSDLDAQRLQVPVHRGKGAKDRDVLLPQDTLELLRASGATHRHKPWLFPATGRAQQRAPPATSPRSRASVQGACRQATHRAGITTTGMALPALSPADAPPLLEAGVTLRLLQRSLGPTRLATTMRSLPLPHKGHEEASERLEALMRGLPA